MISDRCGGLFCAFKESVYAIQRASGASVFGWELMMDATHMAGGFFLLEKEKKHIAWSILLRVEQA